MFGTVLAHEGETSHLFPTGVIAMNVTTVSKSLALSLVLLGPASAAQAADNLTTRVVTHLGQAIASQGNAAFQQIRAEIQDDLSQQFSAWLSRRDPQHSAAGATPADRKQSADELQ
jgi:hypothetical protein